MEFDIKPYKQRGMTCAIACMLMILEYYKEIPKAAWQYEQRYYKCYHSYYMEGTPFSALAWHFAKNNFETEIIHSERNIFKKDNNMLTNDVYEKTMDEYKDFLIKAQQKGTKIINGITINAKLIKDKLEEGKLIILAGVSDNKYLHAILIYGYNDNKFIVCDPLYKQKKIKSFYEIEEFVKTPIGSWLLAVKK